MSRLWFLLIFFLLIPSTIAVGVVHLYASPEARTIYYEPGFSKIYEYRVEGATHLQSYIEGNFSEYATLLDPEQNTSNRNDQE